MAGYQLPFTGAQVEALMNTVNALADWAKAANKPTYTADEVGARHDTWTPSASEVGADPVGTAAGAVSNHNTAGDAHEDIRLLVAGLTERLNALADSDDETLDQVSELVAYIKANRTLIESVTTGKVSVSDIIDNLTTNVSNKPLSAAQGVVLKGLIDAITVPTKVSQLENDRGYLTEHQDLTPYAKTTDLTAHTGNSTVHVTAEERTKWNKAVTDVGTLSEEIADYIVPDYVKAEAEEVADKVLAVRNAYSLVFGGASDLHTTGSDASAVGAKHAGQGMNEINGITQLDLVAIFGDVILDRFNDTYKEGLKYVKKCFLDVSKAVPYIQIQGNHDELSTDTTEEARQKYFAYIGANNVGTVTDFENRFRNYGYRDFEDLRFRVIYLNSVDVSASEITDDCYITAEQFDWLVNTALDFSGKTSPETWHIVVMCHHPLNWFGTSMANLLTLLDAYKGCTSGSITMDGVSIPYDFKSNTKPVFVAHFHGHLHNFRVETLGTNGVLSITIPNGCFNRNNEYGTSSSYDETIHANYGDTDENGNQRQFNKTSGTASDTAFNVVVIDTLNEVIHAFCYGAGIDRTISFTGNVVVPDEPDTPVEPDEPVEIINILDTIGYTDGKRCRTSGISLADLDGATAFGWYDCSGLTESDVVRIYLPNGIPTASDQAYAAQLASADETTSYTCNYIYQSDLNVFTNMFGSVSYADNILTLTGRITSSSKTKFRMSARENGADCIMTLNQIITLPSYTNLVPTSINADGSVYNDTGYKEGYRLNSSGGESALSTAICSGYIPYNAQTIRVYGSTNATIGATGNAVQLFDSSFNFIQTFTASAVSGISYEELNGKYLMTFEPSVNDKFSTAAYIRVGFNSCSGADFIVTLNEEIS